MAQHGTTRTSIPSRFSPSLRTRVTRWFTLTTAFPRSLNPYKLYLCTWIHSMHSLLTSAIKPTLTPRIQLLLLLLLLLLLVFHAFLILGFLPIPTRRYHQPRHRGFSFHRARFPYTCTPIDKKNITIEFDKIQS